MRHHTAILALAGWMALIFGTSCTVVLPREFFQMIREHLIRDESLFYRFQLFWGAGWFGIVKSWHALEFAILFWLCTAAWKATGRRLTQHSSLGIALACIAYAASDEWHQTFIPGRGGTLLDVLIDSLGITVAALVLQRRTTTSRCRHEACR